MPQTAELQKIYAGDSLLMSFVFSDTNGPLNLTGWTWRAMWRQKPTTDPAIVLTVDATQSNVGRLVVSATPEQTATMVGNGVWDLEGTNGSTVRTFIVGNTVGTQDVSRA